MTAAFLSFIGAVSLATLAFVWSTNARVGAVGNRIEDAKRSLGTRIDSLERGVQMVGQQVHGLTGGLTLLAGALTEVGVLSVERTIAIVTAYHPTWRAEVDRESKSLNPLTPDELARFEAYRVKLMERRELLTPEELADYQDIVGKLQTIVPMTGDCGRCWGSG